MRTNRRLAAALTMTALACAACTTAEENVLFVTSTEVGIDADAKTGSAVIGYGRDELFVGPAYVDAGGTPPVVASLQSNLSLFEPEVSQLYATGNAARIATGEDRPDTRIGDADDLSGTRRAMFFGTRSSVGLRLGFTEGSPAPTSITFGYKRQELSIIPLEEDGKRNPQRGDRYASVLAAIDLSSQTGDIHDSGLQLDQYFATGRSAEKLAATPNIRDAFALKAQSTVMEAARLEGVEWARTHLGKVEFIVECIQPIAGPLTAESRQRLATLVDEAGKRGRIVSADRLKSRASTAELADELNKVQQNSVDPLLQQLKTGVPACG